MTRYRHFIAGALVVGFLLFGVEAHAQRDTILALGIPLADHYAGIVAYEKYRHQMEFADYQLKLLPGPGLVRAYFRSKPEADAAFIVAPMVVDMFANNANFRLISLIHRDGNALSINHTLNTLVNLPTNETKRHADGTLAEAISTLRQTTGESVEIAVPSLLATHSVILYKYLKDHGKTFSLDKGDGADVVLRLVKPPKSPLFLKKREARDLPAAIEQSLPWPQLVENEGSGLISWFSKDVMKHEGGHVECVIIAKDVTIKEKRQALKEVIHYIHLAGLDIEKARRTGGPALDEIIGMIRKHIPAHTPMAIKQSLRADLNVVNYRNLNIDENAKASFGDIMDLAFEAGFIEQKINIHSLADDTFGSHLSQQGKSE